jgi:hypothetical protein
MSLRDELQAIYNQHGQLTPALVVSVARNKTHPLHSRVFDRPVKEAAESWYLHRAHELIRSVKVTYRPGEDNPNDLAGSVRVFHAVRGGDGGEHDYAYKPIDEIIESPFLTEILRRDMEREWKALYRRFQQFGEFVDMVRRDIEAA